MNAFTWDAAKAKSNSEKHGVPFEEASTVFDDPNGLDGDDPEHSSHELRRQRLGKSATGRILFIVDTIRGSEHEKESIRIISARQASRKERQAYSGFAD
ncbi:MAG: BrnT family toxin [Nitrospira sp. CR1.3]|nr:BrnT family toxin [Nitrospira sp. CR1.3]